MRYLSSNGRQMKVEIRIIIWHKMMISADDFGSLKPPQASQSWLITIHLLENRLWLHRLLQCLQRAWKRCRRFLALELENVWLFRHCTSEQKFKSVCWLDFLCQNKDANEFIWFYKTQNSNQFSVPVFCQKANFIWKNLKSNM